MNKHTILENLVIYQIYTRSFKDSNNDGIGDLPGVTEKLDYLEELGINMIWLSPFCSSPNDDNGYDISDYRSIMKEFGSMEDLENLITRAHSRGIGIMMDLVLNHSSDEHPWFREARKSRENPYRDFYIWRDQPNNWDSYFTPRGWEWEAQSGQYYYHNFGVKQPDLNWHFPSLKKELFSMVEWWLKKGIDAFRFDAIHLIGKPPGSPDYREKGPGQRGFTHYRNTRWGHGFLRELHREVLGKYNPVTVGETGGTTPRTAPLYVRRDRKELDMIFHFGFLEETTNRELKAPYFREYFRKWYAALSPRGWDALFLGNHDMPRQVSFLGDEKNWWYHSATCLAVLLLTQWGTPFLYQGEEIGMTNRGFESPDQLRDPHGLIRYHQAREEDKEKIFQELNALGRDNSRTPMQWDSSPGGGFSESPPWIDLAPNYKKINVESQKNDPSSILNFYKKAIRLRKSFVPLKGGKMKLLKSPARVLCYRRKKGQEEARVLLNMESQRIRFSPGWMNRKTLRLALANWPDSPGKEFLEPWEARVYISL